MFRVYMMHGDDIVWSAENTYKVTIHARKRLGWKASRSLVGVERDLQASGTALRRGVQPYFCAALTAAGAARTDVRAGRSDSRIGGLFPGPYRRRTVLERRNPAVDELQRTVTET